MEKSLSLISSRTTPFTSFRVSPSPCGIKYAENKVRGGNEARVSPTAKETKRQEFAGLLHRNIYIHTNDKYKLVAYALLNSHTPAISLTRENAIASSPTSRRSPRERRTIVNFRERIEDESAEIIGVAFSRGFSE